MPPKKGSKRKLANSSEKRGQSSNPQERSLSPKVEQTTDLKEAYTPQEQLVNKSDAVADAPQQQSAKKPKAAAGKTGTPQGPPSEQPAIITDNHSVVQQKICEQSPEAVEKTNISPEKPSEQPEKAVKESDILPEQLIQAKEFDPSIKQNSAAPESLGKEEIESTVKQNTTSQSSNILTMPEDLNLNIPQSTGILAKHAPTNEPCTYSKDNGFEGTNPEVEAMATTHWRKKSATSSKKPSGTKEINDMVDQLLLRHIVGRGKIDTKALANLEFESAFEKFLWPQFDAELSSPSHVLLLVLIANQKIQDTAASLPWSTFSSNSNKFNQFYHRVLSLGLTLTEHESTEEYFMKALKPQVALALHTSLVHFITHTFQTFDQPVIRDQCLRLVGISTWHCLASAEKCEHIVSTSPQLCKLWKQSEKKFSMCDDHQQSQVCAERSFFSLWLVQFIKLLYTIPDPSGTRIQHEAAALYCQRAVELLIDLEAQLPSRRFFNTLLKDHQIVELCQQAPLFVHDQLGIIFRQLVERLDFYSQFEIDDFTGQALSEEEITQRLYSDKSKFQLLIFQHFRSELEDVCLASIGALIKPGCLLSYLESLSHPQVVTLCHLLFIRTQPLLPLHLESSDCYNKEFLLAILCRHFELRTSHVKAVNSMSLYPDESDLFDPTIVTTQHYNGDYPLPLPKLNLQFLTLHDYLMRNFHLFRLEAYYEIRQDIEDAVKRLSPRLVYEETVFGGWARMATEVVQLSIVDVKKPRLGETVPARVVADLKINLGRYTDTIQHEWKGLHKHDVLFLLSIQAHKDSARSFPENGDFCQHFGLTHVRGCEVLDVLGDDGCPIDEVGKPHIENRHAYMKSPQRTIRVALDPNQYQQDRRSSKGNKDVYETINVVVRRKPKENNFKAVLDTIRSLMQTELVVPEWLQAVLLGYGSPTSAHHSKLPAQPQFHFHDTFLDFEHLKQCFPNHKINANSEKMLPPFLLTFPPSDEESCSLDAYEELTFSSVTKPSMGPYPSDLPNLNKIRFTPSQVQAIYSGCNLGLTMVVGPPGTGKTDVAVQVISNLYHSHPKQRLLLVTHSNQALNQLFAKIVALDVDPRHLLRLGHGEEELNVEESFSKYGRVNSFLEQRIDLLAEVAKLAQSLELDAGYGETCEMALQFYGEYIAPRWHTFLQKVSDPEANIPDCFPFSQFFSDAPQPLFPSDPKDALEAAHACFRHVAHLFDRIESIRPFELLRTSKDRANHLLVNEARIVAMTCTHAALKRRELIELGFRYDNVVLEEAAQILEIETFIPLVLQNQSKGENTELKRVVLIGDHLQLPPVVKNMGFQAYGNMEQSMFSRLIRLGVPAVHLDKQGRARPQLADLYRWRYQGLGDLGGNQLHALANPGFAHPFQFINLPSTETEPVPYFYQNLVEAEYVVAMYQYMRLIGYPSQSISILTTYNGQVALIKDVLAVRCANNPLLGLPGQVSTVDKYQGEQNDYILLSLVRTKTVGHLRDVRRLTVALSRARLGLYVVGQRELFEQCPELQPALSLFFNDGRIDKLILKPEEDFSTARSVEDTSGGLVMTGLAQLGEFVHGRLLDQMDQLPQENVDMEIN
ncbi:hypothetical protein DSO57_1029333 [Entomophthora muscae]|uniref:Uncharacterized protein n=1 Tax=Entomophthora muscae TaxID=34485 RepID=A0ACC2T1Q2_9FUNG|nr:hypothetical protein DSO57_1029333 [Entomophthora muscae]